MRALYILTSAVVGLIGTYFGADLIHGNEAAANAMLTVYTVFAGFMVAVIAILGDPLLLPSGSWRVAEAHRDEMQARLDRHMQLFYFYLVTIGLVFASVLLKEAPKSAVSPDVRLWIERGYLWFGITGFMLSLALPRMLANLQRARADAEIERRRRAEGATD